MNKKRVSFVIAIVLLTMTMLFAAGAQETTKAPATTGGAFDWKQFDGSTVVFNYPNHVHYNAMVDSGVLDDFTALTGIKVESDRMQYMNMHDAQILQMSKPKGDYDIVTMVVMWKSEYAMADLIRPLQPYFDNTRLAAPNYNFDDLVPAYVEVTGIAGGKNIYKDGPGAQLFGLPFGAETSFMVYRKDLFDQYNIKVPTTYAEIESAAKFFAENVPGVYGLTMRAASGHHATHGWLLHASPMGATVFDENWEPAFTSREAIETIEKEKPDLAILDIQLSGEYEHSFAKQTVGASSFNSDFPALYLGAAYNKGKFAFGFRYDVLYDENKSVYASPFSPIVRFYF